MALLKRLIGGLGPFNMVLTKLRPGVIVLDVFYVLFWGGYFFSLGRVVLYTVFMVFPLPQTLVKTLATNLLKNLLKNQANKIGLKGPGKLTNRKQTTET